MTQPALSHQLREIERRLNCPIVDRKGNLLKFNKVGERLLQTAEIVLPELDRAESDCERIARGQTGNIVITSESPLFYHWFPEIYSAFVIEHPEVGVSVSLHGNRNPISALKEHDIDLAVISTVFPDFPVNVLPLYTEEWMVALPPGHRLAKADYFEVSEFKEEVLIAYSTNPEDNYILREVIMAHGIEPKKLFQVEVTEGLINLVKAGLGIAAIAERACRDEVERGELIVKRLTKQGVLRRWNAVTRASGEDNKHVNTFASFIAEKCKELEV